MQSYSTDLNMTYLPPCRLFRRELSVRPAGVPCGLEGRSAVQRADETIDDLIKNLNSLQERHSTLSDQLSSSQKVLVSQSRCPLQRRVLRSFPSGSMCTQHQSRLCAQSLVISMRHGAGDRSGST